MYLVSLFRKRLQLLHKEPLYRNALFKMLSMAFVSGSGFFFWMLAARFYSDREVGLATSVISVITFIMNVSILGLNYSVIRFLPKSKQKNQLLSSSFFAIGLAAVVSAVVFLLFLPFFSPRLLFVREHVWILVLFIIFALTVSIDFQMESVFMALRAGKYIFIKNLLVSVMKIVLPIFFVALGASGLFIAWALSLSSALLIAFFVLVKQFRFRLVPSFKRIKLAQLVSFSLSNYLVGLLGIAPSVVLPLLITNTINPETTAYFYIAFMIANLLYVIPYATTQSLFAEGSYSEASFLTSVKKALKMIVTLLVPAIVALLLLGRYILLVFGKSYSTEGMQFLQILALAGIPIAINYLGLTYLNVRRQMRALLVINLIGTSSILILSYLLHTYALTGIGLAWLGGHPIHWTSSRIVNAAKLVL